MSKAPLVTPEQTIAVRDHCLCLAAQRAARALSRQFDEAFRPLGITSGQFSLLNALNRREPPPLGALATFLAMDRTTLTANVKPLERKGLIEVHSSSRDKRLRLLTLTTTGREILAQSLPLWKALHAEIDARLRRGPLVRDVLADLLNGTRPRQVEDAPDPESIDLPRPRHS